MQIKKTTSKSTTEKSGTAKKKETSFASLRPEESRGVPVQRPPGKRDDEEEMQSIQRHDDEMSDMLVVVCVSYVSFAGDESLVDADTQTDMKSEKEGDFLLFAP